MEESHLKMMEMNARKYAEVVLARLYIARSLLKSSGLNSRNPQLIGIVLDELDRAEAQDAPLNEDEQE